MIIYPGSPADAAAHLIADFQVFFSGFKEPFKNNLYIFAILPDAFVFTGSLHTFRYAPLRQFTKSPRDISRNL